MELPSAQQSPAVVEGFLKALAIRDFEQVALCLAPSSHARLLLPRGAEEVTGSRQIRERLEKWFGSASAFQVETCGHSEFGARQHATWRFRLIRDGQSWEVIEQTAFIDVGPEGIERIDLLCSGFIREAQQEGPLVTVFDAGEMGCADGLAQEFRRQMTSVAIGGSLMVVVRDPAAIEDIPPLARMLGHSVSSVEASDDGTVKITVERKR